MDFSYTPPAQFRTAIDQYGVSDGFMIGSPTWVSADAKRKGFLSFDGAGQPLRGGRRGHQEDPVQVMLEFVEDQNRLSLLFVDNVFQRFQFQVVDRVDVTIVVVDRPVTELA